MFGGGGAAPPNKPTAPTQQQKQIRRRQIRRQIDEFDNEHDDLMDLIDYYKELRRLNGRITDDELDNLRTIINETHDNIRTMYREKFIGLLEDERQIIREVITLEREIVHLRRKQLEHNRLWYTRYDIAPLTRSAMRIPNLNLRLRYLEYLRDRYFNGDRLTVAATAQNQRRIRRGIEFINGRIDRVRELLRMDDEARRRHLIQARQARNKRSIIDNAIQRQRGRSVDRATGGGGGSAMLSGGAAQTKSDTKMAGASRTGSIRQQMGHSVDRTTGVDSTMSAQTRRSRRSHSDSDIIISRPARTRSLSLSSSRTGQGPLRRQQSPLQQYINRIPDRVDPSLRRSVAQHVLDGLNSDLFTQLSFLFGEPDQQRKRGGAAQQKKGT